MSTTTPLKVIQAFFNCFVIAIDKSLFEISLKECLVVESSEILNQSTWG